MLLWSPGLRGVLMRYVLLLGLIYGPLLLAVMSAA